ncbi:TPA: hypothetical protein H1012_04260 [archaeon]|nr:hypothetical protein [Candidatus Naiadarchaeales archaeon SRR2090153.bin461]HIK03027.1 hypothetical protein [Candidatus Naiadarchaeales archaeon SRR2090159.bin1288]
MAIKDLFKKVTKRVAESVTGEKEEEPFTEDFDKELETGTEEDLFKESEEEKPSKQPEFAEELEEKRAPTENLRGELEKIQNKLDLVDAHLKTIESKEDIFKIEAERYMQYFSFISEKIDHLERELAEVERLLKKKNID